MERFMGSKIMWVQQFLVLLVLMNWGSEAGGIENSTALCSFPFKRFEEDVKEFECTKPLGGGEMVQCLTFLLEQANNPTERCCEAAAETWREDPECFCKLAFFLPGNDIFSSVTGRKLLKYCNVTADLCNRCPSLLRLNVTDSAEGESQVERLSVPIGMGCFVILIVVATVVYFIIWRRRELYLRSMPERDEIRRIEGSFGKPMLFAFKVLQVATNGFNIMNILGKGGFGTVYKGVLQDGSEIAVKKLSAVSRQGEGEFINEVSLITKVQHKNLVKLRGCCVMGKERLLVYEYMENKSLHEALFGAVCDKRVHLDWQTRMKILVGTAHGLAYLHEGCQTRIVHRDIKSSNILLDKDLTAKIADFGLARLMSEDRSYVSTRIVGTFGYWSPEYAIRGHLSEKADVFSYGIVALEMVSGRNSFNDKLPTEQAFLLDWTWTLHENGNLMDILDPVLVEAQPEEVTRVIELALLCTQAVPSVRPSMTKVASVLLGQSQVETGNLEKPSFLSESSTMSRPQASTSEPKSDFRNDAPAITVVTAR